ncbi:MAG: T9SS type A sorting domain-containing protein [Flavobacteriales bacterium]
MSQKFTWLGIFSSLIYLSSVGQTVGDTTTISSHSETHMDWYKNYNETTVFPTTGEYKKILMEYNLGCPTGGCSDWDYTTQINVLKPTGITDSTLRQAPSFTVDGSQIDTFYFSSDLTYNTEFNSSTLATDSTANDTLTVVLFGDTLNPLTPTDTIFVFNANYNTSTFDTSGTALDTTWVSATDTFYLDKTGYYTYFEVIDKIELGRAITPYGGNLSDPWNRQFMFDVTEFASLLKDTTTIQAHYSGWSDGFTADIDFHFINGTPPRNIVELFPLWHASPKYGEHIDGVHTIENTISQKEYNKTNADYAELTFTPTGHGFGGEGNPENCAEFCAKTFDVISNGNMIAQETIWKDDCGENAQFPQPGTWLYDRANWCPGEQVPKFNFDLTPSSNAGTNTIDVDFQLYTSGNQGSYTVDAYVTTYGAFNFQNNVEIVDILAPTNKYDHSRFNPICGKPVFEFKNLSGQNVTSVTFAYGVENVSWQNYTWTGDLAPLQTARVELPTQNPIDFSSQTSNTFFVEALYVNGVTDEDATDNLMKSQFDVVKDFPSDFRVILKTNNFGNQNAWTITDMNGTVHYSLTNPASNQTHEEEITNLPQGCYKFELTDNAKNGLSFWAQPNQGAGSIRIRKLGSNGTLQSFGSDFGSKIEYYFTVGNPLGTEDIEENLTFDLLPNPNKGTFLIELPDHEIFETVSIYDNSGRLMQTTPVTNYEMEINAENLSSGIYIVEVSGKKHHLKKKMIINK